MTEKGKPVDNELYEFNANGSWVSPQMGRYVREHAPTAVSVKVNPSQMKKMTLMYKESQNPDVSLTEEGHRFAGLHLTAEKPVPESEMLFFDKKGILVAKIIGLER